MEAAAELDSYVDKEKIKEKRDKERQKERARVEKDKENDEGNANTMHITFFFRIQWRIPKSTKKSIPTIIYISRKTKVPRNRDWRQNLVRIQQNGRWNNMFYCEFLESLSF